MTRNYDTASPAEVNAAYDRGRIARALKIARRTDDFSGAIDVLEQIIGAIAEEMWWPAQDAIVARILEVVPVSALTAVANEADALIVDTRHDLQRDGWAGFALHAKREVPGVYRELVRALKARDFHAWGAAVERLPPKLTDEVLSLVVEEVTLGEEHWPKLDETPVPHPSPSADDDEEIVDSAEVVQLDFDDGHLVLGWSRLSDGRLVLEVEGNASLVNKLEVIVSAVDDHPDDLEAGRATVGPSRDELAAKVRSAVDLAIASGDRDAIEHTMQRWLAEFELGRDKGEQRRLIEGMLGSLSDFGVEVLADCAKHCITSLHLEQRET